MNILRFQTLLSLGICFIVAQLLYVYKVNLILGASGAVLAASLIPLMLGGLYSGPVGAAVLIFLRRCFTWIVGGVSVVQPTSLYLPTLSASLYLAYPHWLIGVGIPAVCAALFVVHPAGAAAWFYATFWIIPAALHLLARRYLFARMITAVFVAHAVGTVAWLAICPLTPAAYWALMPVVVVERLLLAAGMYMLHIIIEHVTSFVVDAAGAIVVTYKKS